ncbi:hypothetical protein K501DRAFT_234177 [Backusella circina FSU 941]|nr:hypothetical protein K501DRAFT_234177 [Backusella circina FSU 941]
MDDTLSKYDESLEALERQRESLELVMQRMGEEWEESGAGIGWLKDSFYQAPMTNNKLIKNPKSNNNGSSQVPNLSHLMQSVNTTDPSPDYLLTLLNVNDELVAQSLASLPSSDDTRDSPNGSNSFVAHLPVSPPLSENDPIPPPTVLGRPEQQLNTPPVTPD